jgi:hypothetical protein
MQSNHLKCIKQQGLPVRDVGITGLQIGSPSSGPLVEFTPTPGAAQADQIRGRAQGAEAIGSALLYPNQGSEGELQAIENCLAKGVKG